MAFIGQLNVSNKTYEDKLSAVFRRKVRGLFDLPAHVVALKLHSL